MKLLPTTFGIGIAFVVGAGGGWFIFHEPATALHVEKGFSQLEVFTYYENWRGEKIKHGWYYKLEPDGAHELRVKYKRGVAIESHNVTYDVSDFRVPQK